MLASWALDLVLPQLELNLYDQRLSLYEFHVLEDTPLTPRPPDARIAMAASLDRRQGRSEATYVWGPDKDAELLANLEAAGAAGVFIRREYRNEDLDPLIGQLKRSPIGMIGCRWLPFNETDPQVPEKLRAASPPTCIDGRPDADRVYRCAYLAVVQPGQPPVPSGALRLLARLLKVPDDGIVFGESSITVGPRVIPCERDSVGYLVRPRFPLFASGASVEGSDASNLDYWRPLSVRRLLDKNHILYGRIRDRVLLSGQFEYEASEKYSTPGGAMRPFLFQACVLDSLLANFTVTPVPFWQALLLQVLFLALVSYGSLGSRTLVPILTLGVAMGAYTALNFWLFTGGQLWPLAGPLLGMVVTFATEQAVHMYSALRHLLRFGGSTAVEAALRLNEGALFESFERTATILFTNLPDHLKQLEEVGAPELFPRRKEYSRLVIEAVAMHGGQILDYQADFLMVGFNTDQKTVDLEHALNAVRAAWELQSRVADLKDQWLEALDPQKLKAYCGICTGPVALGFVGAREHKKAPAAIGDTTNVAARLLGAAKKMGVEVLISELTMELASDDLETEQLEPVSLKGKTKPVPVYKVTALKERKTVVRTA